MHNRIFLAKYTPLAVEKTVYCVKNLFFFKYILYIDNFVDYFISDFWNEIFFVTLF